MPCEVPASSLLRNLAFLKEMFGPLDETRYELKKFVVLIKKKLKFGKIDKVLRIEKVLEE